jgi:hypothetical protein
MAAAVLVALLSAAKCATNNQPATTSTMTANTLSAEETAQGWRLLFDGKTTAGWRNFKQQTISPGWRVIDGSLVRADSGAGDIITNDEFKNFELALDWKISEGGNSGIFYRATEQVPIIYEGAPEMQVLDDARHPDGKSQLTSAGANYGLWPAPRGVVHPAGEWNHARILVNGNHVEHWLNGTKMVEYELGSAEWKDRVAKSKFNAWPLYGTAPQGHIGLQDHGDRVEYRNIKIKVLP